MASDVESESRGSESTDSSRRKKRRRREGHLEEDVVQEEDHSDGDQMEEEEEEEDMVGMKMGEDEFAIGELVDDEGKKIDTGQGTISTVPESSAVPSWYTRTDPPFRLSSDPFIVPMAAPRLLIRSVHALRNQLAKGPLPPARWEHRNRDVAWHQAESFLSAGLAPPVPAHLLVSLLREDRELMDPKLSLNAPDEIVGETCLHWAGDLVETLGSTIIHPGGDYLDELRLTRPDGRSKYLCYSSCGELDQIAKLKPAWSASPESETFELFARCGATVVLVRGKGANDEAQVPEATAHAAEKFLFQRRLTHAAPSPHSRSMAAFLDEAGVLYSWHPDTLEGMSSYGPDSLLPLLKGGQCQDGCSASERRGWLRELRCDYGAHPMSVWLTARHSAYRIDLRERPCATEPAIRPSPYFRQGHSLATPRCHAILQSRQCPRSCYLSLDGAVCRMDARFPRDPVVIWEQSTSSSPADRLRWQPAVAPLDSPCIISYCSGLRGYGGFGGLVHVHLEAAERPDWPGSQMPLLLSSKASAMSAACRPLTFSFPVPDDNPGGFHGGALLRKAGPDSGTELIQATSLGDVFSQPVSISAGGQAGDEAKLAEAWDDGHLTQRMQFDMPCGACILEPENEDEDEAEDREEPTSRDLFPPPSRSVLPEHQQEDICSHRSLCDLDYPQMMRLLEGVRAEGSKRATCADDVLEALGDENPSLLKFLRKPRSLHEVQCWLNEKYRLHASEPVLMQAMAVLKGVSRLNSAPSGFDQNGNAYPRTASYCASCADGDFGIGRAMEKARKTASASTAAPQAHIKAWNDIKPEEIAALHELWTQDEEAARSHRKTGNL
jgi:hypothetical protein